MSQATGFWKTLWDSLHSESEAVRRERKRFEQSTTIMKQKLDSLEDATPATQHLKEVRAPKKEKASG